MSETPTERRDKVDKQMLESRLKLYKQHKAEVETTLKRIDVWKEMLENGELEYFEFVPEKIPGMPRSTAVTSQVENTTVRNEVTTEMVDQWIKDDESRIFYKKIEIEQIGIAMAALTAEQRAVIESKYLEGMTWRNIEIIFNEKFSRNRVYVTEEGLQKINNSSLEILWEILGPLYSKYLYFRQYNIDLGKSTRKVRQKYQKSTSLPIGKEL